MSGTEGERRGVSLTPVACPMRPTCAAGASCLHLWQRASFHPSIRPSVCFCASDFSGHVHAACVQGPLCCQAVLCGHAQSQWQSSLQRGLLGVIGARCRPARARDHWVQMITHSVHQWFFYAWALPCLCAHGRARDGTGWGQGQRTMRSSAGGEAQPMQSQTVSRTVFRKPPLPYLWDVRHRTGPEPGAAPDVCTVQPWLDLTNICAPLHEAGATGQDRVGRSWCRPARAGAGTCHGPCRW